MAYLLTLVTFLPTVGALLVLALPRRQDSVIRYATLLTTAVTFVVSLPLYFRFNPSVADYQFVERHAWLPDFGISYHVGIDGITLMLVVLTTFLTPIALLCSWESVEQRVWVIGSPEEVAEGIAAYQDALSLQHLTIFPHFPGDTYDKAEEQMQRFAEEVRPLLR